VNVPTALIDALASHRLIRLITADTVPPLPAMRDYVDREYDGTPVQYLISCTWCSGMWVGVFVLLARRFAPRLWGPVAAALAMSSAVGLISNWEAPPE
jgi:hypothetical protein